MKIVKEKQFFIFYLDDGKTVKYDLSTGQVIGKKGSPVSSLSSQLRGYNIQELINSFENQGYRDYFQAIYDSTNHFVTNMSTVLLKAREYRTAEQYYIIGIKVPLDFHKTISEIPKGLLTICKKYNIQLNLNIFNTYYAFPNEINWAINQEFYFLTPSKIFELLGYWTTSWTNYYNYTDEYYFEMLQKENYDYKALFHYIDNLAAFEGLEDIKHTIRELCDYVRMMKVLSPKFEKYPRYFLTTHTIATRNYNRLKQEFSEELFKTRFTDKYDFSYGNYIFTYPKSTQDIKDEAVSQSNCVGSYIQRVLDGVCHIIFMRNKNAPEKSLVTLEIRDDQIVQAKGPYNRELFRDEQEAVNYFNNKFKNRKDKKTA